MKKTTIIVIALIVIINSNSCKDQGNIQYFSENDFLELVKLRGDRKSTSEMLNIRQLFVKDSFLIINNSRDDSIFMVFDLNTFDCIKAWGISGRGPGEYGTFTHLIRLSSEEFQIADFSAYKIETYNIPEFTLESEWRISQNSSSETREIPQKIVTPDGHMYFYDNLFAQNLSIKQWEKGKVPKVINHFNQFDQLYDSPMFYLGSLALNSYENQLFYAYRFLRRFDLMNLKGDVIKTVEITPNTPPPNRRGRIDAENSVLCYLDARVFKNSIFLLYAGHSPKELEKNKFILPSYIEEYDWEGNPLKRYELDRFISHFEILYDKQKQSISFLGIDITDNNPLIIFSEHF